MSKLVFEPAITSSLWLIRYYSVNTETEPNFLGTEFIYEPIDTSFWGTEFV